MKPILFCLFLLSCFCSCNEESEIPDVSSIKSEVVVHRFEIDFFVMDTVLLEKSLQELHQKYPELTPIFLQQILGLDPSNIDSGIKNFIQLSGSLQKATQTEFDNFSLIQQEFENTFRFVKYYFPEYKIPPVITLLGPVDVMAQTASGESSPNFIGPNFIGINLQFYLGKSFPLYSDNYFVTQVAPLYRSRRFEKNYMVADVMKLVVDDFFPDNSLGKNLMEQIIEKGKQAWLLDKLMPTTADSIKTGYTQNQLNWCLENEGMIWNYLLNNEKNIYTTDPTIIQTYIGEAPFTAVFPQASPGNIGVWIGRQILKKFVEKNSTLSIQEVMQADALKILQGAKYKPK